MADSKKEASSEQPKNNGFKLNPQQAVELFENEKRRVDAISQRINGLEGIFAEMSGTNQLLTDFKDSKNQEMIISIGSGYFVTVERKEGSIIKSMPGNVMIPISVDQAIKDTHESKEDAKKELEKTINEHQIAVNNLQQLDSALYQIAQKQRAAQETKKE